MASECIPVPCYKWLSRAVSIACLLGFLVPLPLDSQKIIQLPQIYTIEVVNVYPHDPRAFTEGLLYGGNNTLYESTGLYGKSTVRRVTLQTGKVEALQTMDSSYFGEGLTLVDERLYQLTYEHNTGFIYHRSNLSKIGQFTHQMADGWGLATDGKVLFGSDGSSTLYQIDPKTMEEIQRQTVRYMDLDVPYLNELEYVNGEVWANVATTDCIVRISPEDGIVLGWILLPILREKMMADGEIDVFDILNGIAWDGDEQRVFGAYDVICSWSPRRVEALQTMDSSYFGEGLTLVDERLYQLTYEHNIGFIYDRSNLSKIGQFTHQMADGWGLASDGKVLFGSDGSSTLY